MGMLCNTQLLMTSIYLMIHNVVHEAVSLNAVTVFKHCPVVGFVPECVFVIHVSMDLQERSLLVIMI